MHYPIWLIGALLAERMVGTRRAETAPWRSVRRRSQRARLLYLVAPPIARRRDRLA